MALCGVIPAVITVMISLKQVGKRFSRNWVFKGINFSFETPGIYGILGHNGSGKSTLLRIIGGLQNPTTGKCVYQFNGKEIAAEKVYKHISYCAPGMELIEEMTLREFLNLHFSFKPVVTGYSPEKIIDFLGLASFQNHLLHEYSSGMMQRVKLAQAFFSDTPFLLLDEPCSNLDEAGVLLYSNLLENFTKNRLVLVASNDPREYPEAEATLLVERYRS